MSRIDPHLLETVFVKADTPSFADLMDEIAAAPDLAPTRRRDLLSGLRRVAKALGREPTDIPADPRWLQQRLAKLAPAALGLTPKSWSNALSDARAALLRAGLLEPRNRHIDDLSPAWRALWEAVLASKDPTISPSACRFVHFLNRLGVEPGEVSDEHARAFLDAVTLNEISRSPDVAYRAAVNGWNLAVERIPGWPPRTLALPSRTKRIALPLDHFPSGFRDDLEQYLDRLAHPDPLDPEGDTRSMRPDTVSQYRFVIIRFASVLVHAGLDIEEIGSLAPLVDPANAERGLRWMLDRNEKRTSVGIADTASVLRGVARRHLRLEPERQAAIDRLARRLAVPTQKGMTAKNRERLRPLEDPATLRGLLLLPERLVARADGGGRTPYQAALDREVAAAVAILLACPVRIKNLSEIHLERSLHRPRDGRVFLAFGTEEVKNGQALEFALPAQIMAIIERHLATRSPLLCPNGTPWLFPKRDGSKPIDRTQLGSAISRVIRRELGLEINPHLFRHLAAMIWLNARPGAYEAARRLLGQPYSEDYFGRRIREITEALTGVKVSPHFFRDAAATTLARTSPEAARLTRAVLGHASHRTAQQHYNHARALEAGRDYNAVLRDLLEETDT